MPVATHLEELTRTECLRLLETTRLGRVGVSIGALPAVLPVNFVVDGGEIVIRTVPGTKFDIATAKTVVAFEADQYDPESESGWSVLIRGLARVVDDADQLDRLRRLPLPSWALQGSAERYVRIEMEIVSGRRTIAGA
jgi:nitroimidazol reductase NimA-like FMN-containing flavoprotein (pyridoxamine 5'-phosphate oxidase superfamily)